MSCALVGVAKMEKSYILEWIRYNLHIGFDVIYLYENDDEPVYAEMLKEFPQVKVIPFPGPGTPQHSIQYLILEDFCKNYKDQHTWFIHLDCDEFLVLKKHKSIQELCKEYLSNNEGGLAICWVMFGDSGQKISSPEPVTFRFTRSERPDPQKQIDVKSIVCSACIDNFQDNFHAPDLKQGIIRNTSGAIVKGKKTSQVTDVAQINHYFCKSFEEFQLRKIRGDVGYPSTHPKKFGNTPDSRCQLSFYRFYNRNEIEDLSAKHIYEKVVNKQ